MANVPIRWRDLDPKTLIALLFLSVVTVSDDLLLPVVGELLDPVEILADVLLAFALGTGAARRAAKREALAVQESFSARETER